MPSKRSRWLAAYLVMLVLISGSDSRTTAQVRDPWPLIHIPDPVARHAAVDALETASARFANAGCSRILEEFNDKNGRSLADRLSSVAEDFEHYLAMITFIDDARHNRCDEGALLFTAPGSRVVRVCSDELKRQTHEYVIASFIHEILHTLGLGENPPSSKQITARVLARCGRK